MTLPKPTRCPGCHRLVLLVDDGADHEDCLRERDQHRWNETHPDDRPEYEPL